MTEDVLSTEQICEDLIRYETTRCYFDGVFALDQLPTYYLVQRPSLVVCNTAYSKSRGEHWVGFYLGDANVEYFDSYGIPPSNEALTQFISKNGGDGTQYNTRCLQGLDAATCGKYVVTYLFFRSMGYSLKHYLDKFVDADADVTVRKLYHEYFEKRDRRRGGQTCTFWCDKL